MSIMEQDKAQRDESDICFDIIVPLMAPTTTTFLDFTLTFPVFPAVAVFLNFVLGGGMSVDMWGSACISSLTTSAAVVPTMWIDAEINGGLQVAVTRAGVGVEACILNVSLIPQGTLSFATWPLTGKVMVHQLERGIKAQGYVFLQFFTCIEMCTSVGMSYPCGLDWCDKMKKPIEALKYETPDNLYLIYEKEFKTPDTTPPIGEGEVEWVKKKGTVTISWTGWEEEESTISHFIITVGNALGTDGLVGAIEVPADEMGAIFFDEELEIPDGILACINVQACNSVPLCSGAGLCKMYDAGPPVPNGLQDGLLSSDKDAQRDETELTARYDSVTDVTNITTGTWGIGTCGLNSTGVLDDVRTFETFEPNSHPGIFTHAMRLKHAQTFCVTVCLLDSLGYEGCYTTDGVTIDLTPPEPRAVYDIMAPCDDSEACPIFSWDGSPVVGDADDGTGDADFQSSLNTKMTRWVEWYDPESVIVKYEYRITDCGVCSGIGSRSDLLGLNAPDDAYMTGCKEDETELVPWTQVGMLCAGTIPHAISPTLQPADCSQTWTNLKLTAYSERYCTYVRGTNEAQWTSEAGSDGVEPDPDPPVCEMQVVDNAEFQPDDRMFESELDKPLSAHWCITDDRFPNENRPITHFTWAVGTSFGDTDMVPKTRLTHPASHSSGEFAERLSGINAPQNHVTPGPWLTGRVNPDDNRDWLQDELGQEGSGGEAFQWYFQTVQAHDAGGRWTQCVANGVMWDVTEPGQRPGKQVRDGPSYDRNWQVDRTSVKANWPSLFYDPQSNIDLYQVQLVIDGDVEAEVEVRGYGENGAFTGLDLQAGQRVHVRVKARNRAGAWSNMVESDGMTVEITPPVVDFVKDGPADSEDIDVQREQGRVSVSFQYHDPETRITALSMSVTTDEVDRTRIVMSPFPLNPGPENVQHDVMVSAQLEHGLLYHTHIVATNEAGLTTDTPSDGFMVDFTPPMVSGWTVSTRSGVGGGEIISRFETLVMQWHPEDPESGFASASIGLSFGAGGSASATGWIAVGQASNASLDLSRDLASPLLHGFIYYADLRLYNTLGMLGGFSSRPFLADELAPSTVRAVVIDGGGTTDIDWTAYPVAKASWSGFSDATSGISGYVVMLVRIDREDPPRSHVEETVELGPDVATVEFKLEKFIPGHRYITEVVCFDGAGHSATQVSDGWVLDNTAPDRVTAWLRPDSPYQQSTKTLTAEWYFYDWESGIHHYEVGWSDAPGNGETPTTIPFQWVPWRGNVTHQVELASAPLILGMASYYPIIVAVNNAGARARLDSQDFVRVDTTPPELTLRGFGFRADPTQVQVFSEATYQTAFQTFKAEWTLREDVTSVPTDGIATVEVALGTFRGGSDFQPAQPVRLTSADGRFTTTSTVTGIEGASYHWLVRVVNVAGLEASAISPGAMTIDSSPPVVTWVRAGYPTQGVYDNAAYTSLACIWEAYDEISRVELIEIAVGSSASPRAATSDFIVPFAVVQKNASRHEWRGLNTLGLTHGSTYFTILRATNGGGLRTVASASFVYDTTPADCTVHDGLVADQDFSVSRSTVVGSWTCTDAETGIPSRFTWVVVDNETMAPVGQAREVTTMQLQDDSAVLMQGGSYFLRLVSINNAGVEAVHDSDGFIVDVTPPVAESIASRFVLPTGTIETTFAFTDNATGVVSVHASIFKAAEPALSGRYTGSYTPFVGGSGQVTRSQDLDEGFAYIIEMLATNGAGVELYVQSTIVVDYSPPIVAPTGISTIVDYAYVPEDADAPTDVVLVVVSFPWTFSDPQSGIQEYTVFVHAADPYTDAEAAAAVSVAETETEVLFPVPDAPAPRSICATVRAINGVGNYAESTVCAQIYDVSIQPGLVFDGPVFGVDTDAGRDLHTVHVSWTNFSVGHPDDHLEFTWAVGTAPGADDVVAFAPVIPHAGHYWDYRGRPRWRDVNATNARTVQLTPGVRYFTTIEATNAPGSVLTGPTTLEPLWRPSGLDLGAMTVRVVSDGFIVDTSPPAFANPIGGPLVWIGASLEHQAFMTSDEVVHIWWAAEDPESAVSQVQIGLDIIPGGHSLLLQTANTTTAPIALSDFSLPNGTCVFATVSVTNTAGLTASSTSQCTVVDNTPADALAILVDGSGVDGSGDYDTHDSLTEFTISWQDPLPAFRDEQSGMQDTYEVGLGTFPGRDDAVSFAAAVPIDAPVVVAASLQLGVKYFAAVRGTNLVGLQTIISSDGFTVVAPNSADTTAPIAGAVAASCGAAHYQVLRCDPSITATPSWAAHQTQYAVDSAVDCQTHVRTLCGTGELQSPFMTLLHARWGSFVDSESGLSHYSVKFGLSADDDSVMASVDVGLVTETLFHTTPLASGTVVFATVTAHNNAGLSTSVSSDRGVRYFNTSVPEPGTVDFVSPTGFLSQTGVQVQWRGFQDMLSPPLTYEYAVCAFSKQSVCQESLIAVGMLTSINNAPIAPHHGEQYVALVRATNAVGMSTDVFSTRALVVDSTAPVGGSIRARVGQEYSRSHFEPVGILTFEWENANDDESGLASCELCFGTMPGAEDLIECAAVATTSQGTADIATSPFESSSLVFASVGCTNGAGLRSFHHIELTMDSTAPTTGVVVEVCDVTLDILTGVDCVHLNAHTASTKWSPWEDEESGITHYLVSFGVAPGDSSIVQETVVDSTTIEVLFDLGTPIASGTVVFASVTGVSAAGLRTTASSAGVLYESTPPIAGQVTFITDTQAGFLAPPTPFSVLWPQAVDAESGPSQYSYAVCPIWATQLCAQGLVNVGESLNVTAESWILQHGEQYVALVRATNAVGMSTDVFSTRALVVDSTAPVGGSIRARVGQEYSRSHFEPVGILTFEWENANDDESGLASCELCFGTMPGAEDLIECAAVATTSQGTADIATSPFESSSLVFASVGCTNGAGLRSFHHIELTMDSTAPTTGVVVEVCDVTLDILTGVDCVHLNAHTASTKWSPWEDEESGITHYLVSFGVAPGDSSIVQETVVDSTTIEVLFDLGTPIASGTVVFASVTGVSAAGLRTTASSAGVLYESTPPIAGQVDIDFHLTSSLSRASWSASVDTETPPVTYSYAICEPELPDADCQARRMVVGMQTNFSSMAWGLVHGAEYTVRVYSTNAVNMTTTVTSAPVTMDKTPAQNGVVLETTAASSLIDVDFLNGQDDWKIVWTGLYDSESTVDRYLVCAGTEPGRDNVLRCTEAPVIHGLATHQYNMQWNDTACDISVSEQSAAARSNSTGPDQSIPDASTIHLLANATQCEPECWFPGLECGRVYTWVVAINGADTRRAVYSDSFMLDTTPPVVEGFGAVCENSKACACQAALTSVQLFWQATDAESGIARTEVAIGTHSHEEDVYSFSPVGNGHAVLHGLTMQAGTTVVLTLRVWNGANSLVVTQSELFVDDRAPAFEVFDGLHYQDTDHQAAVSSVCVSWIFEESTNSDHTKSRFAVMEDTSRHRDQDENRASFASVVQSFQPVQNGTSVCSNSVTLRHGHRYYITLEVTSCTGLRTEKSTDGFVVDTLSLMPKPLVQVPQAYSYVHAEVTIPLAYGSAGGGRRLQASSADDEFDFGLAPYSYEPADIASLSWRTVVLFKSNDSNSSSSGTTHYGQPVTIPGLAGTESHCCRQKSPTMVETYSADFAFLLDSSVPGGTLQVFPRGFFYGRMMATLTPQSVEHRWLGGQQHSASGWCAVESKDDRVLIGFPDGVVSLINTSTMQTIWTETAASAVYRVALDDDANGGAAYFLQQDGTVHYKPTPTSATQPACLGPCVTMYGVESMALDEGLLALGQPQQMNGKGKVIVVDTSTQQEVFAHTGTTGDALGASVALKAGVLAVGATGAASVLIFNASTFLLESTVVGESDQLGISLSLIETRSQHVKPFGAVTMAVASRTEILIYHIDGPDRPGLLGQVTTTRTDTIVTSQMQDERILFVAEDSSGEKRVYTTAFCARGHHRTPVLHQGLPPFECRACPLGHVSPGGLSDQCTSCVGRWCIANNDTLLVEVGGEAGVISNGTEVVLEVSAHAESGLANETLSGGSTYDRTPPITDEWYDSGGYFIDGLAELNMFAPVDMDMDAQWSRSLVRAAWTGFSDTESGIESLQIGWGTQPGLTDVISFFDIPVNATAAEAQASLNVSMFKTCVDSSGVVLPNVTSKEECASQHVPQHPACAPLYPQVFGSCDDGTTCAPGVQGCWIEHERIDYYATLLVRNGAGLVSNISTDGFVVDKSPPTMVECNEGLTGDVNNQEYTNLILGNWKAIDNQTKPFYEFRVRHQESGVVLTNWTWAFDRTLFGKGGLDLEVKEIYMLETRALTESGAVSSSIVSNGIKVGTAEVQVDSTKPTGMMFDSGPVSTDGNSSGPQASAEQPLVGSFAAPAGAIDDGVSLVAGRVDDDPDAEDPADKAPSGFSYGGYTFEIGVKDENGSKVDGYVFAKPAIISLAYDPGSLLSLTEQPAEAEVFPELLLYDVYSESWIRAENTCPPPGADEPAPWTERDKVAKLLHVQICHLTQFAVAINVDDCVGHTCRNGATCVDGDDTYTCVCTAAWTGKYCTSSVDDCAGVVCQHSNSVCIDGFDSYHCECASGWTGDACEIEIVPPPPPPWALILTIIFSLIILVALALFCGPRSMAAYTQRKERMRTQVRQQKALQQVEERMQGGKGDAWENAEKRAAAVSFGQDDFPDVSLDKNVAFDDNWAERKTETLYRKRKVSVKQVDTTTLTPVGMASATPPPTPQESTYDDELLIAFNDQQAGAKMKRETHGTTGRPTGKVSVKQLDANTLTPVGTTSPVVAKTSQPSPRRPPRGSLAVRGAVFILFGCV
eukprot:COSAG02_NODE_938_length_15783_cov_7.972775_2_plen_4812_part_01